MSANTPGFGRGRAWTIAAAAVLAVLLMAWGLFHPEFRPDLNTVNPSIREELAKTGFRQTAGVSAARLEDSEFGERYSQSWTAEQKIVPIDGLITEKRTRRRGKGVTEEYSGFYVGPFPVIRFYRVRPPLVGDLLPYQFWSSRRMSQFKVDEIDAFPNTKGGKMRARVTYEAHYPGGEFEETESRRLQCDVTDIVEATSINPRLSGTAARIDCRSELETDGRRLGVNHPQTQLVGSSTFSYWYIQNRGWAIPLEGQSAVRVDGSDEIFKWTAKLVSFEASGE
jgi:hypothetical protein